MKITTRLIILLCVITALFVVWVLYVQRLAQQQAELLLSTNINSKNTAFDRNLKLEAAPVEAFVYDFSCRNDFFSFMLKPDRAWADDHLASLLPSYKVNGVWVYDSRLSCVYAVSLPEGALPRELPVPRQALSALLAQRYFYRFFVYLDAGLLEVRCAPIQPADDWERKSPPRGFLFVGRLWNEAYIDELSALTESRITLRPIVAGRTVAPPSFDFTKGAITFSRVFLSWDDTPLAELAVYSEVSVLRELARSSRRQFFQLLTFLSIVLISLIIAFVCWVQMPLKRLSKSLAEHDPEAIAGLQKQRTEYGDFARLIMRFFSQQQDLSREIVERRHAQEELERTNEMLRAREQTLQALNQQVEANMQQLQASEHTLRESQERYRSLIEHIELGIALVGTDYRIIMVNRKCAEMYGKPAEYYAGKFCYTEFENAGVACSDCPGATAMKTGLMARVERKSVRSDGSWFDTSIMAFPVFENGTVKGFIEVSEDITQRKELEEKLGEREAFFRAQFELGNIGIGIVSVEKIWLRVNQRLCNMLGYTEEELCGMSWADMTYPDDVTGSMEQFNRMLAGEIDTYELDKRYVCKNGDILWTHLAASCFREQDRSVRFVIASIQDITRRRQMEEQLRQSQKMEAIGTLAGGIAHDFNNILAAIVGNAELALLELPAGAPAAGNVDQILKASERARNLVRQILAFSRRQDQERRPVDICSIVNEAVKLLRAIVPTTIDVRTSVPADAHIAEADPTRLHQVIINLCTNAAQAMEATGGVLEIDVASIQVDSRNRGRYPDTEQGRYVRIMVSDTGPGIEPRHMPRIFDPFFTTKEVGRGTGMGLAVAHGIVKDHGGSITAYSRPGKGATFSVLIPQISRELVEKSEMLPETQRGEGKVLLIDDEEMLVDIGTTILQSLGYTVLSSTSSAEALKMFTADPAGFDAVLTDFTMPYLTGYELAQEFLRIRADIPIILCTGFSSQISEEQAQAAGIRAFIMKPYNMREIAAALQAVMAHRQPEP
jgi:PAS domain S-box-containing protein